MPSMNDRYTLRDGNKIPIVVFGSKPPMIHQALDLGWRAFDAGQEYKNEAVVGENIRTHPKFIDGTIPRSEIWVTSKLANQKYHRDDLVEGIKESVDKMGLGYIDLFIIHKPFGTAAGRKRQWKALVEAKRLGYVKSIGVSNFGPKHLEEIKAYSSEMPVTNQIEVHPWNQNADLIEYCKKEGILVQAYTPLARAEKKDDPVVAAVAKEVGKSWSQVVLRWEIQKGYNFVNGSKRLEANIETTQIFDFELSDKQMATLDSLECGYRCCPENELDIDIQKPYSFDGVKVTML